MKQIATAILVGVFSLAFAGLALANEGLIKLQPVGGASASCVAMSVYKDNRYQILGSCRDLRVPFSAEESYYVMWRVDEQGNWKRLTEVDRGKFSATSDDRFVGLQVTAEKEWSPRKPSEAVVATGSVEPLPLNQTKTVVEEKSAGETQVQATPMPTTTKKAATNTKEQTETKTSGSWLGALGRLLGTIFLVLLGGVVVMTIITRRKGF